jgi:2',3'-cyclic-nucleotide 2'-phosphodiesterase
MRILFLGDVMGRAGRAAVCHALPHLRAAWRLDFVVVNGENATGGMGLSPEHAKSLLEAGADCITLGDHAFDQRPMREFIAQEPRVLRPLNFAKSGAPGMGARVYDAPGGRRVLVAQVLGQVFMKQPYCDPFSAIDPVLRSHPRGGSGAGRACGYALRGHIGEIRHGPLVRWPRQPCGGHAYAYSHRRCPNSGRGHGVSGRCRHVRRL